MVLSSLLWQTSLLSSKPACLKHCACRLLTDLRLLHRCGQTVDLGVFYKRVEKGQDINEAWDQSLSEISARTQHGVWKRDIFAGKSGISRDCSLPEVPVNIRGAL